MNPSRLLRFLGGTVVYALYGSGALRLPERCRKEKITLLFVAPGEDFVRAQLWQKDEKAFLALAGRWGVEAKRLSRAGLPQLLSSCRCRYGLWAGVLLSGAFLIYTQFFVWTITLKTNDPSKEAQALESLADLGVCVGAPWSALDLEQISQRLYFTDRNLSFAALNRNACSLEVWYSTSAQTSLPQTGYQNMVAAQDGLVTRVEALSGTAAVEAGQTVSRGQVLISGVGQTDQEGVFFSRALGNVYAQTVTRRTFSFSLAQRELLSEESRTRTYLRLFHLRIPLFLTPEERSGARTLSSQPLSLFGASLPLGLESETTTPYAETETLYTPEQGQALLLAQADRYEAGELCPVQVFSRAQSFSLQDGELILTVEWTAEVQIARPRAFTVG